jgi:hypothetical protein
MLKRPDAAVMIGIVGFIGPMVVLIALGYNPIAVFFVVLFAAIVTVGWYWGLTRWLGPPR